MGQAPYRQDPPAATPGLRTLGTGATQAAPGSTVPFAALARFTSLTFNGTDDVAPAINAALASLSASGGGRLVLPDGTGLCSEPIAIPDKCGIVGQGMRLTRLALADGVDDSLIKPIPSPDTVVANAGAWSVADMFLSGNSSNQTGTSHGIYATTNPTGLPKATNDEFADMVYRVTNVFIHDFLSDGFNSAGRSDGRLLNVRVQSCQGYGYRPGSDTTLIGCVAGANGLSGFRLSGSSLNLGNCKSWGSGAVSSSGSEGAGFLIQSAGANGGVVLTGAEAQDNVGAGFVVFNSSNVYIDGLADSNSVVGVGVRPGVDITTATSCDINVRCMEQRRDGANSYQRQALRIRTTATGNRINVSNKAINGATINANPIQQYDADCVSNDVTCDGQRGMQTLTYAASITVNPYAGEVAAVTLTGNVTFAAPTNRHVGTRLTLLITQGGAGSFSVSFNAVFRRAGGAFTATATVGKTDSISFVFNGTDWIETARALNT